MLKVADRAPDFELATEQGPVRLSRYRGQPVVIYFYPKDDTSGCTAEARAFSGLSGEFAAAGAIVLGISPDGIASHARFRKKHGLSTPLAADEDKAVANAYGVWVQKSMYGRTYMGIERATFLVDGSGRIAAIWRKVKVPGHAETVLEAVRGLAR